jgi:hypothetical protein
MELLVGAVCLNGSLIPQSLHPLSIRGILEGTLGAPTSRRDHHARPCYDQHDADGGRHTITMRGVDAHVHVACADTMML